jgi:predicted nucleic acid-binding protein
MFLLDTNVISELRKHGDRRSHRRVSAWVEQVDADSCYVSAITLFELELGILLLERRGDGKQGQMLRSWYEKRVLLEFSERTLPVDAPVARRCARLHVPRPRPDRDGYIAATALVHGLTVVTRNVSDFDGMGLALINPWEFDPPQTRQRP